MLQSVIAISSKLRKEAALAVKLKVMYCAMVAARRPDGSKSPASMVTLVKLCFNTSEQSVPYLDR